MHLCSVMTLPIPGYITMGERDQTMSCYGTTRLAVLHTYNATECTYIMDNSTYASPAVVNGVVYEGSLGNNMTAFNAMTGAVLWDVQNWWGHSRKPGGSEQCRLFHEL